MGGGGGKNKWCHLATAFTVPLVLALFHKASLVCIQRITEFSTGEEEKTSFPSIFLFFAKLWLFSSHFATQKGVGVKKKAKKKNNKLFISTADKCYNC